MTEKEFFEGMGSGRCSIPKTVAADYFLAIKEASLPPTAEERKATYERLKQAALKYAEDSLLSPVSDGVPSGDDPLDASGAMEGDSEAFAGNESKDPNRNPSPPKEVNTLPGEAFTPEEMDEARRAEMLYQEALLEAMGKEEEANHYRAALDDVQQEKSLLEQQMQQYAQQAQQSGMAAQQMEQQVGMVNQQLAAKDQELMAKDQQYSQLLTSIRNYQAQVQAAVTQAPLPGPEMAVPGAPGPEGMQPGVEMLQEEPQPPEQPQGPEQQQTQKTASVSEGASALMGLLMARVKDPSVYVPAATAALGAGAQIISDRIKDRETGRPRKVVALENRIREMEGIENPDSKQRYGLALARAQKALVEYNQENPKSSAAMGAAIGGFVGRELTPVVRRGIRVLGPIFNGTLR